jgi:hypothetical protein
MTITNDESTTPLGFEPRQREPKSLVLPLHYGVMAGSGRSAFLRLALPPIRRKSPRPLRRSRRHSDVRAGIVPDDVAGGRDTSRSITGVRFVRRRSLKHEPLKPRQPTSRRTKATARHVYPSGHAPDLSTNAPWVGTGRNRKGVAGDVKPAATEIAIRSTLSCSAGTFKETTISFELTLSSLTKRQKRSHV